MKDLIILVADKDAEHLVTALLKKLPRIENIREFSFEVVRYSLRDSGVRKDAADFLRPMIAKYKNVLVLFDHEGSGRETIARKDIEKEVEKQLSSNGWDEDSICVAVISPELENWVWVHEQHLKSITGWTNSEGIYDWLEQTNLKSPGRNKPDKPKEAFDTLLRKTNLPHSSSLFQKLGEIASYKSCEDPAFLKVLENIRKWFAASPSD